MLKFGKYLRKDNTNICKKLRRKMKVCCDYEVDEEVKNHNF